MTDTKEMFCVYCKQSVFQTGTQLDVVIGVKQSHLIERSSPFFTH